MSVEMTAVEQVLKQLTGTRERRLFVIAGPSGVGKNTIIKELLATHPEMARIKTYTTRPPRDDEQEGDQYCFRTQAEFQSLARAGKLLEADADNPDGVDVYGTKHSYSMPSDLYEAIPPDRYIVLAEVDIDGAALLRTQIPTCVTIFITAPPLALLQRIQKRDDEKMSLKDLRQRMKTAREHIQAAKKFDYVVYNRKDRLRMAIHAVETIIAAERMRVRPGFDLEAIIPESAFRVVDQNLSGNGSGE